MQLKEMVNHVLKQLENAGTRDVTLDVALAHDGQVALNDTRTVCRIKFTVRVKSPNEKADR